MNNVGVKQKPKKEATVYPRREPSIATPPRDIVYITPGETTCKDCGCFPYEEPYRHPKKLTRCQKSPLTLYELCAHVVDATPMPEAFNWGVEDVCAWMADTVGFPQYQECMRENFVNGRRLLRLEDPSVMPAINIHCHEHIEHITLHVRKLFGTDFIYFTRSIGLPPRKPWTHIVWFKSRTGPKFGWRESMTPTDILRWMKILEPCPLEMDHWDRVWWIPEDFPKVKFARPHLRRWKRARKHICQEYEVPRKYRIMPQIAEEHQKIWKQHRPGSAILPPVTLPSHLNVKKQMPTTGNLALDRRRRPRAKFSVKLFQSTNTDEDKFTLN